MTRIFTSLLLALALGVALLAGVGAFSSNGGGASLAAEPAAAAVTGCSFSITGDVVTVDWSSDMDAASYVVSRRVDDGPMWWRGRVTELSFIDEPSGDSALTYQVQARRHDGTKGQPVPCPEVVAKPLAPSACTFEQRDGAINVSWESSPAATGAIILRSFNGGTTWWRGRVAAPGTTFTDSGRDGELVYFVALKNAAGISARTQCLDVNEQLPLEAPPLEAAPLVEDGGDGRADDQANDDHMNAVAFGDMVTCGQLGPERVARLIDDLPGFILGLGDFSQEEGTREQFANCFDPVMGRHKDRIEPVPGNHEYRTPGAEPYFEYFGAAAGDPDKGYYSRIKGNWQILYLNSSCWEVGGCEADKPQQQWLERTLDAAPDGMCRIAIMHHPRWSSWGPYTSNQGLDPIYGLLYEAGTDMILTGHAHHYERLVKLDANGRPDPENGFRQITAGTGGTLPRFPDAEDVRTTSSVLETGVWGVLDLDLYENSYAWRFVTVQNEVLDNGTDTCLAS